MSSTFILDELISLLVKTPHLSNLSCGTIVQSYYDINRNRINKLNHLKIFKIVIADLQFNEFEHFILKSCLRLETLIVQIVSRNEDYLNGDRWESLILQHMPLLNEFIFCYSDTIEEDFEIKSNHLLINRFASPFWTDRQ
jgi:hypothetical protein